MDAISRNASALSGFVPSSSSVGQADAGLMKAEELRPALGQVLRQDKTRNLNELIDEFIVNRRGFIYHATLSALGGGHKDIKSYMNNNHFMHVIMHGLLDGLSVDKTSDLKLKYFDRSFSGELRMQVADSVLLHLGVADGFSEERTNFFKIKTPSLSSLNDAQLATCYSQIANLAKMLYMDVSSDKELMNDSIATNLGRKLSMIAMNSQRQVQKFDNNLKSHQEGTSYEFKNPFSILDSQDRKIILQSIERQGKLNSNPWYQDIMHHDANSTNLDFTQIKPLPLEEVAKVASWIQHVADHLRKILPGDDFRHLHSSLKIPFLNVDQLDLFAFDKVGERTVLKLSPELVPFQKFHSL